MAAQAGETSNLKEEIIFVESQTWEALKQSGLALLPFLAPDCAMMFPGGTIFDACSEPTLKDLLGRKDMKPWIHYKMSDIRVLPLGSEAAAICYSVVAHREDLEYEALISSVWRRYGGSWRMCLHQQTPAAT